MTKAKLGNWRAPEAAPIVFISGPEDYLATEAIRSIRDNLRKIDPQLEVHEIEAADYTSGQLTNLTSPSLFAEPRLLIIRGVERCSDDLITDGLEYLENLTDDAVVILRHNGSSVRGKKLVEAIRANGHAVEIACPEIKKHAERVAFVQAEFAAANRKIEQGAIRALLDAFAESLPELAAACGQLLMDSSETISEQIVDRYYGGRVETNSYKVVDAALAGDAGQALTLLRHALASGADAVPMVAAFAMKIRQMAKLFGNRSASASDLGLAPWQLDRLRSSLSGWQEAGLIEAIEAVAATDAAVKGAERDPIFALERLTQLIARKGMPVE